MKKMKLAVVLLSTSLMFVSCTKKLNTISKNAVAFPGMTVSRADYKLSKDVTGDVTIKEWSTLFGRFHSMPKATGEDKKLTRQGLISGYALDGPSKIAAYKLMEKNPEFDYLTNIRVKRDYTKKWLFLFTKYESVYTITAKGITLNTDK